jgi:hypothetical protein
MGTKRKAFIEVCKIDIIKKSDRYRFLVIYAVVFYILPLLTLIPWNSVEYNLRNWFLLLIAPIFFLLIGIAIGFKYGFYPLYGLICAVLFIPSGLIYGFKPVWEYVLLYGLFSFSANLLTVLLESTKKENKKGLRK